MQRMEAVQPLQPTHMTAMEAPVAFSRTEATPVHEARMASDSTMVSGVSMTSGTPVHHAVAPVEAHEMYNSADSSPASEPMQRTQMSNVYEALQPSEGYNPLMAREAFSSVEATPVEESYNPLQSHDGVAQSGGASAQPLRPTVAYERPTRPSE
jgi:hypothetical protein